MQITVSDDELLKIGRAVAAKSKIRDKQEAFSVALLGLARGLKTFDPTRGVKLSVYLYSCAKRECWTEYWYQNRIKRGKGFITESLDEMKEQGREI